MKLGLGVDTGGTYTDSVIVEFNSGKILAKAKALTTRHDLSVGMANSIDNLGNFGSEQIGLVSVSFDCKTCNIFLSKMLGKEIISGIDLNMSVKMPIVAIGAPVKAYFPPVVSKLKTQLIIPEHAEVANAIGAITGNIIESVEIIIEPVYTALGIAGYTVHSPEERVEFEKLSEADMYAKENAIRLVKERTIRAGAGSKVEIKIERLEKTGKVAEGHTEDNSDFLLSSSVKATAVGKPSIFNG